MAFNTRFIAAASASLFLLAFGLACSSAPDTVDDELRLDEERAEDLLQTPDVLMALRIEPDRFAELTPALQRLADSSGDREIAQIAAASSDPVGHLAEEFGMPNELPSLDSERPSYLVASSLGNLPFLQPALLGMPTDPEEWPAYVNLRLLLPTEQPDSLSEELTPWLDNLIDADIVGAYRLFDGPQFVRVEFTVPFSGAGHRQGVDADAWLDDLNPEQLQPPAEVDFRPTPAYDAFVEADSPVGFWSPIESFSALAAFELLDVFASDYNQVGPAGQPRFFLEGVSRIAAAGVAEDPLSAEHEDIAVLLSVQPDDAVAVDFHATRTERGADLHRTMERSYTLPELETASAFLHLGFLSDLDTLRQQAELPYWTTIEEPDEPMGFESLDQSALPFSDDDNLVFTTLTMALQYPWTGFLIGSEILEQFVPLPRAMRLDGVVVEDNPELPVGAVLVGAFPDVPETRTAIQQLFMLAESYIPDMMDAEFLERGDELLEVRLVVGIELAEAFGDSPASVAVEEPSVTLDLTALDILEGMVEGTEEAADIFDTIHLRSRSEETHQSLRLSIGTSQELKPEPITSRLESLRAPQDRCRTEIASAAVEHLSDLQRDPQGKLDAWIAAVEERASRCIEPTDPAYSIIDAHIERARDLAAEIP